MSDILNETKLLLEQADTDGIQKHVVGAYVLKDNKVLLLQRSPGEDFLPDLVELPSGGVDPGETLIQAVMREIAEETGLVIQSVDGYINSFDYTSGSGKKARQYNFAVTIEDTSAIILNPAEHCAYFWAEMTEPVFKQFNLSDKTHRVILNAAKVLLASAA